MVARQKVSAASKYTLYWRMDHPAGRNRVYSPRHINYGKNSGARICPVDRFELIVPDKVDPIILVALSAHQTASFNVM